MSAINIWLQRGKKVEVGGRELYMMPLPISKLFPIIQWVEENSEEVIHESVLMAEPGKKPPNPLTLVTRVLGRVDVSNLALNLFQYPKDPDTREPINKNISKQFFDDYLDIPTAHKLFNTFVEMNDLPELVKNLQSLPVVKKLMEVASLTFGMSYLSSLQQSTASPQSRLEGSPSHKSTDSAMHSTIAEQVLGETETKPQVIQ